jgi:uncharacterized protein
MQLDILEVIGPLVVGIVGSVHCLGMCGPLVLAYSVHLKNPQGASGQSLFRAGVLHHAAFHSGRLFTYVLLGGVAAGFLGQYGLGRMFNLRSGITISGGVLMVLLGCVLLGILRFPRLVTIPSNKTAKLWTRLLPPLFQSRSMGSKLILGVATGFLPCGLSWSMILKAATCRDALDGLLTMLAFGLGTVPLLLATGLSASLISLKARIFGERIAAVSVIIMGLILIFKGVRAIV